MTGLLAFISGHWEILVILAIALLLFGHRIPGMARSLGSGISEFKRGLKGDEESEDDQKKSIGTKDQPHS